MLDGDGECLRKRCVTGWLDLSGLDFVAKGGHGGMREAYEECQEAREEHKARQASQLLACP